MTITLTHDNFEAFFEAGLQWASKGTVSPLKSDMKRFFDKTKNPLFKDPGSDLVLITAHQHGKTMGRICAHIHQQSNSLYGWKRGYFGYFECCDDQNVANALLTDAQEWLKARGMTEIMGNFNLTAMQMIGVVTDDFSDQHYSDQVNNGPHIPRLLEAAGFEKTFPMRDFELDLRAHQTQPLHEKSQEILNNPSFAFLPITRQTLPMAMDYARTLLNASFKDNPMFVPLTKEEFDFQAQDLKWVIDPKIAAILTYEGKPIAVTLCIPDLNPLFAKLGSKLTWTTPYHWLMHKLFNKRAVIIYYAVDQQWQGKGVNAAVLHHLATCLKQRGYTHVGGTWVSDVNKASLASFGRMQAKPLHRLHLYRKSL